MSDVMNRASRTRRQPFQPMEMFEPRRLFSAAAVDVEGLAATPHDASHILVRFREEAGGDVRGLEVLPGTAVGRGIGLDQNLRAVRLGDGVSVAAALARYRANPLVEYAEPNWIYTTQAASNDPYYTSGGLWGMYGDASSPANKYGSQAAEAWAGGQTGSGNVYVGVVDEGMDYTHPDLYRNVWINQPEIPAAARASLSDVDGDGVFTFRDLNDAANAGKVADANGNGRVDGQDLLAPVAAGGWADGVNADGNFQIESLGERIELTDDLIGWDFSQNNNATFDGAGDDHGTHVAGTIGATGGNGTGVAGVNWDVTLISAKFLGAGGGSLMDAVQSVDYFTNLKRTQGLNVVATNNSWGGGGYSQALHDAIIRAAKADILFIAAAGNGNVAGIGQNNDSKAAYPANYNTTVGTSTESAAGYDAVISVAAIDSTGRKAGFSNYGKATVDLGAPGVGIRSTVPLGADTIDGTRDGYAAYNGTSMATPHVTGAAALYAAAHGGAGQAPTAASIRHALFQSARETQTPSLSTTGRTPTATGGRLNVSLALSQAAAYPPATVTASATPGTGTTTSLFSTGRIRQKEQGVWSLLDGQVG